MTERTRSFRICDLGWSASRTNWESPPRDRQADRATCAVAPYGDAARRLFLRQHIIERAAKQALLAIDVYRRAAGFVDKILEGAKSGDLPVEGPMRVDMAVNLKAAKALGVTIPESIVRQAVEVIE